MQTYQNQAANNNNMASFVARLMSLNTQELQYLHADSELMRQLTETQLLMENRLQHIQLQSKIQLLSSQYPNFPQLTYLDQCYQQLLRVQPNQIHQPNTGHPNALDLTTQQQQQQHQQQNQQHQQQLQESIQDQQDSQSQLSNQNQQWPHMFYAQHNYDYHPEFINHSCLNVNLNNPSPNSKNSQHPKKIKLSEYQRSQREELLAIESEQNIEEQEKQRERGEKRLREFDFNVAPGSPTISPNLNGSSNSSSSTSTRNGLNSSNQLQIQNSHKEENDYSNINNNNNNNNNMIISTTAPVKKYKGEFDEPSPEEVEQRLRELVSESYHDKCRAKGSPVLVGQNQNRCACVLGSEFENQSVDSVLEMIDKWRHLPTAERIKTKWDVTDLPKDIPLSEIKKFEDLRRDASNGRADFGGASKRKPLGIRGTRQFLLILYCLWGHPGREDPMQKEGYCPHCFAKIKKANEQSTLVRVVNHFNMKHRRGANPRLSPHRDNSLVASTAAACKVNLDSASSNV